MGQGVPVRTALPDDDVAARGVRPRPHLGRRRPGRRTAVDPHVGEVGAEPGLHVRTRALVQRPSGPPEHLVNGGPLHLGPLLPVLAPFPVPMPLLGHLPGPPQHLQHGGVPGSRLQPREPRPSRRWPGSRLPGHRPVLVGSGRPRPVAVVHVSLIRRWSTAPSCLPPGTPPAPEAPGQRAGPGGHAGLPRGTGPCADRADTGGPREAASRRPVSLPAGPAVRTRHGFLVGESPVAPARRLLRSG